MPTMNGEGLTSWMRHRSYTSREVAGRLGVTERTVFRWRAGHQPLPPYLWMVLRYIESEEATP